MQKTWLYGVLMSAAAVLMSACSTNEGGVRVFHRDGTMTINGVRPAATQENGEAAAAASTSPQLQQMAARPKEVRFYRQPADIRADALNDPNKRIEICLATQSGRFIVNGGVVLEFPVCTGMRGYETPRGTYTILQRDKNHRSNIYHVAMPYFMRLTYDGIGLHVGAVRDTPSSHGCIRLPRAACSFIYDSVRYGTVVEVY